VAEFEYAACDINNFGTCGLGTITDIYTWEAPVSPTPLSSYCQWGYGYGGVGAGCFAITADVFDTASQTDYGPTTIFFGTADYEAGSGFSIPDMGIQGDGVTEWSGYNNAPTFVAGTYTMWMSEQNSPQVGTLYITTPEPSMLSSAICAGLLGLFALWCSRQRNSRRPTGRA